MINIIDTLEELICETKIAIEEIEKLDNFYCMATIMCSKFIYDKLKNNGFIGFKGLFDKYPIVFIERGVKNGIEINYLKEDSMGGVTTYKTILLRERDET